MILPQPTPITPSFSFQPVLTLSIVIESTTHNTCHTQDPSLVMNDWIVQDP
jgi:hypothetical protein